MLKKVLSSAMILVAMNASAGENYFDNEWDAKGLIAIEGAGGAMNLVNQNATSISTDDSTGAGSVALKMGGESKYYRLFIEGRYFLMDADGYETSKAASLGVQIDYLIRAGEHLNIFMGLNGGGIYSKFQENPSSSTTSSPQFTNQDAYAGVQAGVNIDIIDNLGIELGLRAKHVFTDPDVVSISNMYDGYAAIVFKFTGEY